MLTREEVQRALRASRAVPVAVPNPHGPLGLEQLAAAVEQVRAAGAAREARVIELPPELWSRLDQIASSAGRPTSATELAAAIVAQHLQLSPTP
jgi:hypothetical protein